ncbi:MAG: beta-ketoacyl synthase chain length factor [Burkholderiaceae bacterium]
MKDVQASAPLIVWVEGIGVRGPGLDGWLAARDVLAGRMPYQAAPTTLNAPPLLPPAERRRVGKGVKVALDVGCQAVAHSGRDAAMLASVFASSSGDGDNCDAICRALATDRLISPTRFHNSVHNAPSGYWGIAAQSMAASTSLCAFDASFAAGLMDATAQLACGADAVLLVAYDAPYPEPLHTARPAPDAFGVALVLTREPDAQSIARIEIARIESSFAHAKPETRMDDAALEACRASIPAARALPLLAAIAHAQDCASEDTSDASKLFVVIEDVNATWLALTLRAADSLLASPIKEHIRCA